MLAESHWIDVLGKEGVLSWKAKSQHTKKVAREDLGIGSPGSSSGPSPRLRPSFAHGFPEVWLGELPIPFLR